MKKYEKSWVILILAGLALAVAGCTRTGTVNDLQEEHSVQYTSGYKSINGEILLDSTNGLKFKNLENGEETYVCAVAGCMHDDNDDECTAARFSCAYHPILYDGKIYVISAVGNAGVYSCKLDGSNLKKCYDFQKDIRVSQTGVRVDQYFYYLAGYEKQDVDEEGYVYTTEASAALYCTDLTDGATKVVYQFPDSFGIGVGDLWYSGNKIVTRISSQKKSLAEAGYTPKEYFEGITGSDLDAFLKETQKALEIVEEWIVVNLEEQIATELDLSGLGEEAYPCGAWKNCILYKKDNALYSMDLDTNEEQLFQGDRDDSKFIGITMLTNGILVYRTRKEDSQPLYEFYSDLSSEPVLAKSEKFNHYAIQILCESESTYYALLTPWSDDASDWAYDVIDKKEFWGLEY